MPRVGQRQGCESTATIDRRAIQLKKPPKPQPDDPHAPLVSADKPHEYRELGIDRREAACAMTCIQQPVVRKMSTKKDLAVPKSKAELLARYPDPSWRERYLELSDVRDFFRGCILNRGYTIPDSLNNAIHLNEEGSKVRQQLITKHSIPPKEATVLCFLTLAHVEPLIDLDRTHPVELRKSLDEQIRTRKVLLPHAYGRLLYDKGAELFKHETPRLTFEETLKLLEDTPVGFAQLGRWTVGPFGVVEAVQARWIPPRRRIPLYHCSNLGCHNVHFTELQTNFSAAINQFGDEVDRVLRTISERPSDWGQFEAELTKEGKRFHDDRSKLSLHWLLGDCLSSRELAEVVRYLADQAAGKSDFRDRLRPLGIGGRSTDITESRSHAELMQLALVADDDELALSIDELVTVGRIAIPSGEVRRPVLNFGFGSGAFDLRAEIGSHGVRFVSGREDLAPLRLKRLIRSLYPTDGTVDTLEFEWQLRGADASSLDGKLEQFMREQTPREVVRRLVLNSRVNVLTACHQLGINHTDIHDDDQLVDGTLWKLGYAPGSEEDFNRRFWRFHGDMKRIGQTAGVSAVVDEDEIRAMATNFFVELEGVLDDSLAFVTWLLLRDHISQKEPFTYNLERDRSKAFELLNEVSIHRGEASPTRYSAKNELFALCRGFDLLADRIEELASGASASLRPVDDLPLSEHGSDLRAYPFRHYELACDLTDASRRGLVSALRETSLGLSQADVPKVRNSWQHYRRSRVPLEPLVRCLDRVASVIGLLEASGLCRIAYSHAGLSFDAWGRGLFHFVDPRGREISITAPTGLDTSALPSPIVPQYLITSAMLDDSGVFVRCGSEQESEFSRQWVDFPARRLAGKAEDAAPESLAHVDPEELV